MEEKTSMEELTPQERLWVKKKLKAVSRITGIDINDFDGFRFSERRYLPYPSARKPDIEYWLSIIIPTVEKELVFEDLEHINDELAYHSMSIYAIFMGMNGELYYDIRAVSLMEHGM